MNWACPREIYFNREADRLYVTTAKTGHLNIFDIGADPKEPKLLTAAGAPHVAFSPEERYAFVQNSLLKLPEMSDGSITVVDLVKEEVVAQADVLKNKGFSHNRIVLLPKSHVAASRH